MKLSFFIARRYLFSKKKQNAINIISAISVAGVAIGTTALIVILSVFNGIDLILQKSTDSMTPDLIISPVKGKFANFDSLAYRALLAHSDIDYFNPVVEENALLKYGDRLKPVVVKGVIPDYGIVTGLEENIIQGEFHLREGDLYTSVVGQGVAAELGIGLNYLTPLVFYYPNKEASSLNAALNTESVFPAGFFSSQQGVDSKYILTDINFARKLFRLDHQISKIEIKLKNPEILKKIKVQLQKISGENFKVEDKYEINRSFYAMMKSEKLVVFLILLFILFIASFNIVGSISMLILDKKEDLATYKALGMTSPKIISVFRTEGNLITYVGAFVGLVLGVLICFLQQTFGFIKLGEGNYIIEAYPVKLVFGDIAFILLTVLLIGYIASYFPVKYLIKKLV
ncbi:ABC transporter permease [uncultured Odoribacter sp.]|uniref:ABC transporter permease n=1 Tax=uncultured Odoribacter sp. TaxID=876416 RepID=UPI002633348D|nr:ABC transporter permease [uncultured Odoribacter sp.]